MYHNMLAESKELDDELNQKLSDLYKVWEEFQNFFLTDEETSQVPTEKRIEQFITDIRYRLPELQREDLNETPKRLPIVTLTNGKTYFVDRRLDQLRNVKNPHDYIDF